MMDDSWSEPFVQTRSGSGEGENVDCNQMPEARSQDASEPLRTLEPPQLGMASTSRRRHRGIQEPSWKKKHLRV